METSLPTELTSTPLAPIAFIGLDVPSTSDGDGAEGRHSAIWKAFAVNRSQDRVPLKVNIKSLQSY